MKNKTWFISIVIAMTLILSSCLVFAEGSMNRQCEDSSIEKIVKSSDTYNTILNDQDVTYIYNEVKKFIDNNPTANIDEINNLIYRELEKVKIKHEKKYKDVANTASISYDDLSTVVEELNPLERALYDSNRTNGLLCLSAGYSAMSYSQQSYQSSTLHNGNGDAFRHCYWNALMTINVGSDWAEQWATAHEEGTPGNPILEKQMDMYNNMKGREIGTYALTQPSHVRGTACINQSFYYTDNGLLLRIDGIFHTTTNSTGKL